MPEGIETRHARRKREALRGAALFALLQLACAGCFTALCFIPELPGWTVVLFAALAAVCVVPIAGSCIALRQRFREIEGGEQDAAGQY